MTFDSASWLVLAAVCSTSAVGWTWPEGSESVRIDTKVRFVDDDAPAHSDKSKRNNIQMDDAPFREPTDTGGFYNRPPGVGRYPVQSIDSHRAAYMVDNANVYHVQSAKNNFEQLTYCKCLNTPDCAPRQDSTEKCGVGKYLCCYKRPNKDGQKFTDFFNDIDDERPMLYPGQERLGGPFPPPPAVSELTGPGVLVGPNGPTGQIGPNNDPTEQINPNRAVLVGPQGPTGLIGPNRPMLSGPYSPTGQIGPNRQVLSGPNGPTGIIGPAPDINANIQTDESAQRGVLVGPGGPTGIIGPYGQRGVLSGFRGPTGNVGPRGGARGILVGPRGPTGYIGPGYGRQTNPGILVGPGGPTGIIGPGRQILVGPGGPTGRIGPQRYFGNY